MNNENLAAFIRGACKLRGISLGEASKALGHSRNWLERIVNFDHETGKGIRRPRVENCKKIAAFFGEDPNYIMELAGYISPANSPAPIVDTITSIIAYLPHDDQITLLEYARLLKFRAGATAHQPNFPENIGVDWDQLEPGFARNLAIFIQDEPATIPIWKEALETLPERAVELLLMNAQNQVVMRDKLEICQTAQVLTQLAHIL